jgi:hypothetical protein
MSRRDLPGVDGTSRLRVRLVRDSGTEIHLLAPVLGESFLSEQMEKDLRSMLEDFSRRAVRELEADASAVTGKGKP